MVMFKILEKTSQNHFCPFQGFEIFLQEIFHKNPRNIHHVTNALFGDLAKSHVLENNITSSNPLKTISVHFEV